MQQAKLIQQIQEIPEEQHECPRLKTLGIRVVYSDYPEPHWSLWRGTKKAGIIGCCPGCGRFLRSNTTFVIKEAFCDENRKPVSEGRIIAKDLARGEAQEILDRLYDSEKIWWMEKACLYQN